MIAESGKDGGYRSFEHWAKSTFDSKPESQKESDPIQESAPIEEEPIQEPMVEEEIADETNQVGDVVSTLLEKLSDFEDWDEPKTSPKKTKEKVLPDLKKIEEKIDSLVKEREHKKINEEKVIEKPAPIKERVSEEIVQEDTKRYKIFKDRDENFECQLSVEGASLTDAKVRIVLESESWNFVFYGKVYGDGKCVVPIKRGLPLMEGASGNIKLEVIADDQLFVGWEDSFKVATSKKVKVELKEQKSVKVSFNNSLNENCE